MDIKTIKKDYTLNPAESKVLDFFLTKTSITKSEIQIKQRVIAKHTEKSRLDIVEAIKRLKAKHILEKKPIWGCQDGNKYSLTIDFVVYLKELIRESRGNRDNAQM